MVQIAGALPQAAPSASMLLQVHDELVFEVPEADVTQLATFVTSMMESVVELDVPLVANAGYGANWLDAH
jgi:DNA polymerase-1